MIIIKCHRFMTFKNDYKTLKFGNLHFSRILKNAYFLYSWHFFSSFSIWLNSCHVNSHFICLYHETPKASEGWKLTFVVVCFKPNTSILEAWLPTHHFPNESALSVCSVELAKESHNFILTYENQLNCHLTKSNQLLFLFLSFLYNDSLLPVLNQEPSQEVFIKLVNPRFLETQ